MSEINREQHLNAVRDEIYETVKYLRTRKNPSGDAVQVGEERNFPEDIVGMWEETTAFIKRLHNVVQGEFSMQVFEEFRNEIATIVVDIRKLLKQYADPKPEDVSKAQLIGLINNKISSIYGAFEIVNEHQDDFEEEKKYLAEVVVLIAGDLRLIDLEDKK